MSAVGRESLRLPDRLASQRRSARPRARAMDALELRPDAGQLRVRFPRQLTWRSPTHACRKDTIRRQHSDLRHDPLKSVSNCGLLASDAAMFTDVPVREVGLGK